MAKKRPWKKGDLVEFANSKIQFTGRIEDPGWANGGNLEHDNAWVSIRDMNGVVRIVDPLKIRRPNLLDELAATMSEEDRVAKERNAPKPGRRAGNRSAAQKAADESALRAFEEGEFLAVPDETKKAAVARLRKKRAGR